MNTCIKIHNRIVLTISDISFPWGGYFVESIRAV
jgi:hypothetical protein